MKGVLAAVMLMLSSLGPLSAQQVRVGESVQRFHFGDPLGVGLESYGMTATTLGVEYPVLPWLDMAVVAQHGRATMRSGAAKTTVSGLTDATVSASFRAGAMRLKALYTAPTGRELRSADAKAVAGLAADEYFPFPVRSWGRGGGYGFEVTVPLALPFARLELFGGMRRHGSLTPFDEPAFEYHLGSITEAGLRGAASFSAFTHAELTARLMMTAPDDADLVDASGSVGHYEDVFDPGTRLVVDGRASFLAGETAVVMHGELYYRGLGRDTSEPVPGLGGAWRGSVALIAGVGNAGSRMAGALAVDTRTDLGTMPLVTTARVVLTGRDAEASGRLFSVGLGTEIPVFGPWPGRIWLVPSGTVHRGRVSVGQGYESSVDGWGLSIAARWEGAP